MHVQLRSRALCFLTALERQKSGGVDSCCRYASEKGGRKDSANAEVPRLPALQVGLDHRVRGLCLGRDGFEEQNCLEIHWWM